MNKIYSILILLFIANFPSLAFAQSNIRFALVIDQVEYSKLAKLDGARDEADQIASSLEKTGFEITRARNLSKDNLFNTLNDFRRKIAKTPGAIAFIYYTGHGAHNPGDISTDNYLLGVNADLQDPSDLPVFGVKLSEIISGFEMVKADAVIIVIDACRISASFGKAASKGLLPVSAGNNILVAYSTGAGDVAEVGVYAPYLAHELVKSGQDISTAFTNAKFAVNQKTNKKQLPWIDDKLTDRICLVSCAPIPQPNIDDTEFQKTVWEMVSNCAGYDIYLKKWPNGIYSSQAKQKKSSPECTQAKPNPVNKEDFAKKEAEDFYAQGVNAYTNKDFANAKTYFEKACDGNKYNGCNYLGILYDKGYGVTQSYSQAKIFYEKACNENIYVGCHNLGYYYDKGYGVTQSYSQAKILYEKACAGNNFLGCNNLGYLYDKGNGVTQSFSQAKIYYEKACDGNEYLGCNNLGVLFNNGQGVTQSYSQAKIYYEKACNGNNYSSCTSLGILYDKGNGVAQSYSQAKIYYEKACDGNEYLGCNNLGGLYQDGVGVTKSYSQAKIYYEKACDGNNFLGCKNLGGLYKNGQGVVQSYSIAASLLKKACEGADYECNNYALLFGEGKGVPQSYSKALEYFEKACNANNRFSCYNIGDYYSFGKAGEVSYTKAKIYYEKACDNGNYSGCNNLGYICLEGQGVTQSDSQAKKYFEKACEGKFAAACLKLAEFYRFGTIVKKSIVQAKIYYEKACNFGDKYTCEFIKSYPNFE